jgi:hypothetical protein
VRTWLMGTTLPFGNFAAHLTRVNSAC